MKIRVSKRAFVAAALLLALHASIVIYVDAQNVLYDQNDLEGILWWLAAFWVFPLVALATLIVSISRHVHDHKDRGN